MKASYIVETLLSEGYVKDYKVDDLDITGPSVLNDLKPNTFIFCKQDKLESSKELFSNVLVLIEEEKYTDKFPNFILVDNCRLIFALLLDKLVKPKNSNIICSSSEIHHSVILPKNCTIGSYVFIDEGCEIGENTVIESHSSIEKNVRIGSAVYLKAGVRIGVQGFGFERDKDNRPIRMYHSGGVVIGDNVEIGSNTIVCSGTILPTTIGDDTKIDDQVHLTHNCKVGQRSMIAGCASIGGSVTIGDDVWIGPNTSIMNKVKIGDRANVVLGSRVMRDVPEDKVFMNSNKSL